MDTADKTGEKSAMQKQKDWLSDYQLDLRVSEQGLVASIGDGIAWVSGLPTAALDDVLRFEDGSQAVVFALTKKHIGAVLTHQTEHLTAGSVAHHTGKLLSIPVGKALLGRVIDPLGKPMDGKPAPRCHARQQLDVLSPPLRDRDFVNQPLLTGNKIIDSIVPIGKGQRQLIVGDRGVGRSALAIDAVVNQRDKQVYCIYVLIGQKRSTVVNLIQLLKENHAMEYTTVVVAEASALSGLKYLAPFAGAAIAESWMYQGHDTLIVYDELSTHAQTYRELSLLLRRPPGREAYPGDIFYLHSRLLERSTHLSSKLGGGSMTALPIVETHEGNIASYIPTNLISITDGQIYLDAKLFASGFRPAIDITRSVSRIGGKAQHPRIKQEAGRMKLDYLQFLELEVFTRFGSRLEASMQKKIQRGQVLRELLKQDRLDPLPENFQLAWLIAFNEGLFDELAISNIENTMNALLNFVKQQNLGVDLDRQSWTKHLNSWFVSTKAG